MNPRPPQGAPDPEEPHRLVNPLQQHAMYPRGPERQQRGRYERQEDREEGKMRDRDGGNGFGKQLAIGLALFLVAQAGLFLPAWGKAMAKLDALETKMERMETRFTQDHDDLVEIKAWKRGILNGTFPAKDR